MCGVLDMACLSPVSRQGAWEEGPRASGLLRKGSGGNALRGWARNREMSRKEGSTEGVEANLWGHWCPPGPQEKVWKELPLWGIWLQAWSWCALATVWPSFWGAPQAPSPHSARQPTGSSPQLGGHKNAKELLRVCVCTKHYYCSQFSWRNWKKFRKLFQITP